MAKKNDTYFTEAKIKLPKMPKASKQEDLSFSIKSPVQRKLRQPKINFTRI
jgi:hypothetical protein